MSENEREAFESGFQDGVIAFYDHLLGQADPQLIGARDAEFITDFLANEFWRHEERVRRARTRPHGPRVVTSKEWDTVQYRCVDGTLEFRSTVREGYREWRPVVNSPIQDLELLLDLKENPNVD